MSGRMKSAGARQVVVDTETTGLEFSQGHRVIEIGCIEMIGRRMTGNTFHHYVNPQREIDEAAVEVHGITADQLADKPRFGELADELLEFINGAELIIHNAPFDVGFLNHEFESAGLGAGVVEAHCAILDTLALARHKHPGQRNSLDALCKRYSVDDSQRALHGALMDAEILADVYLAMTGGQATLLGDSQDFSGRANPQGIETLVVERIATPLIKANDAELKQHRQWLELLDKSAKNAVVWRQIKAIN